MELPTENTLYSHYVMKSFQLASRQTESLQTGWFPEDIVISTEERDAWTPTECATSFGSSIYSSSVKNSSEPATSTSGDGRALEVDLNAQDIQRIPTTEHLEAAKDQQEGQDAVCHIFLQYQEAYGVFSGGWELFLEGCVYIKFFVANRHATNTFLWDDLLRFYSAYYCIMAPADSPSVIAPFYILYNYIITKPEYMSNVINQNTINDVLEFDSSLTSQILSSRVLIARQKEEARFLQAEADSLRQ